MDKANLTLVDQNFDIIAESIAALLIQVTPLDIESGYTCS